MHKPFLLLASLLITSSLVGCSSAPESPHHTTNNITVKTINGITYTTRQPVAGVEITQIQGKYAYGTEVKSYTREGNQYLLNLWEKNLVQLEDKLKIDPNNNRIKKDIRFLKVKIASMRKYFSILEKKGLYPLSPNQENPKIKGATTIGSVRFTGNRAHTYAKSKFRPR